MKLSDYPLSTNPTNATVAGIDENLDVVLFSFGTVCQAVSTALANEVTARQNADNTLQGNINSEATTRATADSTLQGLIDAIDGQISDINSALATKAAETDLSNYVLKSTIGAASGIVPLDANSKIPTLYIPGSFEETLEYANQAAFPPTGSTSVMYIALDTGRVYRWSGSIYVELSPSPGSTDAVPEGSVNLYFTNARAIAALSGTLSAYLTTSAASSTYLTQTNAASTYLTIANAASTYQTQAAMSNYLTTTTAASTYLTQSNAASTYLTISNASSTYATQTSLTNGLATKQNSLGFTPVQQGTGTGQLTNTVSIGWSGSRLKGQVDTTDLGNIVFDSNLNSTLSSYLTSATAASTYQTQSAMSAYLTTSSASSTYLTQTNAASTYLSQSNAASTYLTQSNASSTYMPFSGGTHTGAVNWLSGGGGQVTAVPGDASHSGYFEFKLPGGGRVGYIGFASGNVINIESENSYNYNFSQRPLFNGATPWDSANFTPGNYLTTASAASTYLTQSSAASTYQTQSAMSSYLTTSAAASTYQTALGFTPVQQGGGANQTTNKIYIGWSAGSRLRAQVDSTDLGNIVFDSNLSGYATQSYVTSQGYITSSALSGYATQSFVTSQGYATTSYVDSSVAAVMATDGPTDIANGSFAVFNAVTAGRTTAYFVSVTTTDEATGYGNGMIFVYNPSGQNVVNNFLPFTNSAGAATGSAGSSGSITVFTGNAANTMAIENRKGVTIRVRIKKFSI